jgi:hypothetical protein
LADLSHKLAGGIELKQPRAAVIEGALVAERRHRVSGPRIDKHVAARVRRHAGDFTVRRQRDDVGVGVVIDLRHGLREQGGAARGGANQKK